MTAGSLDDVLAREPAALRCPYGAYAAEREAGVRFSDAANAYVVSGHDDVVEVLRDHRTFSSTVTLGIPPIPPESEMARYVPLLLLSDDPEHAQRRRIVSRAFTPSRIRAWEPRIARVCEEILDGLAGRDEIDFVEAFAIPLPVTVITWVLGVPEKDATAFRAWSDRLAASIGGHNADRAEQLRVAKEFAAHLDPLLDAAREGTETSIFASIAAAEAEDGLPRHDAARFVMELLVAGNITTTHHLSNSMLMLARDPVLAARLPAEPGDIARFVEESLRLETPIQGFYRLAMADAEIGGVRIPAEARVLVLYASANRDPAAWTDAGEPVLDRPNAASHLAFGRGVHACIGAALARAEGRIALEHLLRRLDAFELAADPAEIEYLASAVNHGPARLPLRLTWAQAAGVIDRDPDGIHAKGRFRSITQAGTHQSIEARQRWEGGVYENRYVKEDGRWRIQRLDFRQVWHCTYEHGWAYMGMDYPDYITERHPADPYGPDESWHMFPDTRLIDFHYPHPITGEWVTSDLGGPPPSS